MRKPQSSPGCRTLHAGLATIATAALVVAATATPAFATPPVLTQSVTTGGASGTITVSSTGFLTSVTTPAAFFTVASSCVDPYATSTVAASLTTTATIAKVNDDSATISVPSSLTLGTSGATKAYKICVYAGTTVGTSVLKATGDYTLAPVATPTAVTGASGGGNTLTVNVPSAAPIFTTSTVATVFTASGGCPAAYGTPSATLAATATKVSTIQVTVPVPVGVGGTTGTSYAICFYSSTNATTGLLLAASALTGYSVTLPSSTLSSTIGPVSTSGSPVNLTLTSSSAILTGVTTPAVVMVAATGSCSAMYPSSPSANTFATARKLATTKAAFTVPTAITVVSGSSTEYRVCLYSAASATTGRLLAVSSFTVANVPAITAVTPNSGPALGYSTITVTGTYFPTTAGSITATLGGLALTSITPIDPNTFTAVTPPHATGSVALSMSTAMGSDTLASAYTYLNSIQISPNTAPNTSTAQDVDVQGSGFLNYTFSATANAGAHVYLVDGVYNGITGTGNTVKANGPVADCGNVLVISDAELVCSLNLTAVLNAAGSAVVPSGYHAGTATTDGTDVLALATGTFAAADVGKTVAGANTTNIPAGTTITAVLSPTTAVMSATALTTQTTAFTVNIGYQSASITAAGTSGNYTVTGLANVFSQADVGRYATGTGVGTNAIVVAVDPTGATATLSVANSGTPSALVLASGNEVPDGAYSLTVVSNADENAALTDPAANIDYAQTVVTSGSVFAVAPY